MNTAYKTVRESVDKDGLNIDETMKSVNVKNFKTEIEFNQLPNDVQSLLQFPYISSTSAIDSIKFDDTNKKLLIKFQLNYKKISNLFFMKANSLNMFGKIENKITSDSISEIGVDNMRLCIVIDLKSELKNNESDEDTSELNESEETDNSMTMSPTISSFKQSMSDLRTTILLTLGDIRCKDEGIEMLKIFDTTIKDIKEQIKAVNSDCIRIF
jgi:hypothetical protein